MASRPPPGSATRLGRLLGDQWQWLALGLLGIILNNGGLIFAILLVEPFINVLRGEPTDLSGFTRWLTDTFPQAFTSLAPATASTESLVTAMGQVVGALVVAILIMVIGQAMQWYCMNAGIQRLLRDLRNRLYRQVTTLSLDYYERERTGQVLAHITTDIAALRDFLTNGLGHMISMPMVALAALAVMVARSPQLTLYGLIILPPLAGLFWVVGRKVRAAGKRSLGKLGDLSTQLTETVVGMPVVKAFNQEEPGAQAFALENRAAFKAELTKVKARALMMSISMLVIVGAIGGLMLVGLRLMEAGNLPGGGGALVAFMVALYKFADSVSKAGGYWAAFQEMLAAADRIFAFLALNPTVGDAPGAGSLAVSQGTVAFEDVLFSYAGEPPWALDHVSFTIPAGQTIALVGPSGSGKTSLAKLLLRFYDPQDGRITIDGQDIARVTQHSLRERMAFVPQNTLLFSGTIASNIRFGKGDATDAEVIAAATQANAHEFIAQLPLGYDTPVGERGITLSGGQGQRLAIARALLRDPVILILDEATSALDTQSEQVVQEALTRLMGGRTTLVIAHRLSTILNADQILVLHQGQIVQRGTHGELFASDGMYRELYQLAAIGE